MPGNSTTVLVIDDEAAVLATTAMRLRKAGYTVLEAACGDEALRVLESRSDVTVIVSDCNMPGMTGTELARVVQADRPGLPVLIVSGFAEVEGIAPDLPRLSKPFRQADLAAKLADLIGAAKV